MTKVKTQYVCHDCQYQAPRYLGRCPNCGKWNTFVEEFIEVNSLVNHNQRASKGSMAIKPKKLADITTEKEPRVKTQLGELNRVLGGGVVSGSLVLIGGDPGIGKSTLLLQVSGQLSQNGRQVLYVSGEESVTQIKMRADRLSVNSNNLYLYPETDIGQIRNHIDDLQPDYVIIDSVQTMSQPDIQSTVGSIAQIREVTAELMRIAKTYGIAIFVIGHVTKDGAIAGPKILEHMVDTVLYFEGDLHHTYRILRTVKNRFGSTNELGIFEMQETGLVEVKNPSELFLEERLDAATGSSIVVSMEGTRPILVEIQALLTPSVFGNSQRTASGINRNRVSLIMAVLEKRAHLMLQNQDAYLKAAGGVKLDEPAVDLALAISIASSYRDKGTDPTECYVGEIGLTGEIRRVNRIESRVNEATKLGFKRIYIPKNNLNDWTPPHSIDVIGVATISQALHLSLG